MTERLAWDPTDAWSGRVQIWEPRMPAQLQGDLLIRFFITNLNTRKNDQVWDALIFPKINLSFAQKKWREAEHFMKYWCASAYRPEQQFLSATKWVMQRRDWGAIWIKKNDFVDVRIATSANVGRDFRGFHFGFSHAYTSAVPLAQLLMAHSPGFLL